jgi:hypothetical protein
MLAQNPGKTKINQNGEESRGVVAMKLIGYNLIEWGQHESGIVTFKYNNIKNFDDEVVVTFPIENKINVLLNNKLMSYDEIVESGAINVVEYTWDWMEKWIRQIGWMKNYHYYLKG